MAPKIFLTGATGYIGGDALFHLVENHPDYEVACLVRNSQRGSLVASQYSKIRLVYGSLDDDEALEKEAREADIVLSCASADHEGSVKAFIRGLSAHSPNRPGYLIHTSGTGILCWQDIEHKTYGEAATKIYDDWNGIQELTSLPDFAPHRKVDKLVLAAGTDKASPCRTAIVCPPTIYGNGRGPGSQRSIQMPDLTKSILQEKKGFHVCAGKTFWNNVHVNDLSDCYLKLVEAAVTGGGTATWGAEGYYLTENGTHVWGDMSKVIASEAYKQSLLPSAEVISLSSEEVDRLSAGGSILWGANSRGSALRARKLLGWSPKGKSIEAETPQLVTNEAKSLGLIQGHALKAQQIGKELV